MALSGDIQDEICHEAPVNDIQEWFDFIMATEVDGIEIPK